jgi:hypothetical protein
MHSVPRAHEVVSPATLHYFRAEPTSAMARLAVPPAPARARRAWLTLLAGWGLAVAAVFVPVLHFVLVPALLFGTPLLAWSRWKERITLLGAEGMCPACGELQHFREHGALQHERTVRCERCGRALVLRIDPAAVPVR